MKMLNWAFPAGALLTVAGVLLSTPWDRHSYIHSGVWTISYVSALALGTLLAIIGSVLERRRLPVRDTRPIGITCWLASGVSLLLMLQGANLHDCAVVFSVPAFVGFVSGAVLLSKLTDGPSAAEHSAPGNPG